MHLDDDFDQSNNSTIISRNRLTTGQLMIVIILSILGSLALVIASACLAIVINYYSNNTTNLKLAKQNVLLAKQDAEESADNHIDQETNELIASKTVADRIVSSKVDVCYTNHQDQGWVAVSWYQKCYLRYVVGFSTNLDKNEFYQKIQSLPDYANKYGKPNTYNCSFERDFTEVAVYRPAGTDTYNQDCGVPPQKQGTFSVDGAIILDDYLTSVTYSGFDPNILDNTTNQFWLVYDKEYYHEDMGCGLGLLCPNPRSIPIISR